MGVWRILAGWRSKRADSRIADEASAYLHGWLLEFGWHTGPIGPLPPWLWLNAVAHGEPTRLSQLAEAPRSGVALTSWPQVRGALAHDVLVRTGGEPEAVAALQREVLVPLEIRIMDVSHLTPAQLHAIALQELRLIES